jgi:hypothetical protein
MPKNPLMVTGSRHELKKPKAFGRATAYKIPEELKFNLSYVISGLLSKSLMIYNYLNFKLYPL